MATEEHHDDLITVTISRKYIPYVRSLIETGRGVSVANAEDPDPTLSKEHREYWRELLRAFQGILVQLQ